MNIKKHTDWNFKNPCWDSMENGKNGTRLPERGEEVEIAVLVYGKEHHANATWGMEKNTFGGMEPVWNIPLNNIKLPIEQAFAWRKFTRAIELFETRNDNMENTVSKSNLSEKHLDYAKHCLGIDRARWPYIYSRHGKRYYQYYRNYFDCGSADNTWEDLVAAGYAETTGNHTYYMTDAGIEWVGKSCGLVIKKSK